MASPPHFPLGLTISGRVPSDVSAPGAEVSAVSKESSASAKGAPVDSLGREPQGGEFPRIHRRAPTGRQEAAGLRHDGCGRVSSICPLPLVRGRRVLVLRNEPKPELDFLDLPRKLNSEPEGLDGPGFLRILEIKF
jgi:hypothetical protein